MEKIDVSIPGQINPNADIQTGIGKALRYWTTALALLGGFVLVLLAAMSVASIFGRVLFSKPIQGDFELAQMMSAMAVALFLPYCHLRRAHVLVDFFTAKASKRFKHWLDAFAGLLMTLIAGVFARQLFIGLLDGQSSGETSMLLAIPIWWPYTALVLAFATLSVTALYFALIEIARGVRGSK
jgi:TRAP-type C4-dicarboxylate transport system permease small subunit